MRRDDALSSLVTGGLIPACLWGLMASLLLHLIHVRSIFIAGGEWRLRQAVLAFALGVILVQRLSYFHGRSTGAAYGAALLTVITLFALHNAYTYRLPVPWGIVFIVNEILFLIVWWVGRALTAACAVDSEEVVDAAGDRGILPALRRRRLAGSRTKGPEEESAQGELTDRQLDALWAERLPARHPGIVILYFSLFALPAFGLGVYVFPAESAERAELGALLFIYMWCALSLLCLASLSQLRAYFDKRQVTLPDGVVLNWLAIGFFVVTAALLAAVFFPQPGTAANMFVRERIVSVYRGFESRRGVHENLQGRATGAGSEVGRAPGESGEGGKQPGGRTPRGGEGGDQADVKKPGGKGGSGGSSKAPGGEKPSPSEEAKNTLDSRYKDIDQLGDKELSKIHRDSGIEPEVRNLVALTAATKESFADVFRTIVKILIVLAAVCGMFVLYAILYSAWRTLSEGLARRRWLREKTPKTARRKPKKENPEAPAIDRLSEMPDPFGVRGGAAEGNEIVRRLWEALVAFCEDRGAPCPAHLTPREFVDGRPEPLQGFEDSARFLADLVTFAECSGEDIPADTLPRLRRFWSDLRRHAASRSI